MGKKRRKRSEKMNYYYMYYNGKKKKRGFTWNLKFSIVVSYIIILYFLFFLLLHPFQIHSSSTFALHTMKKMNNIFM